MHEDDSVCLCIACPACVCAYAQTTPTLVSPAHWGTASWAIYMGFEHERIHIETSSVLIREVRGRPNKLHVDLVHLV